jgi:hypothetical protein
LTTAHDEQAQQGTGRFCDVVDVQLLDESLLLAARIARSPADGSATVTAVAVDRGERVLALDETAAPVDGWDRAAAGPLQLATEEPLERWALSLTAPGARVELSLRAATAPVDLADPSTAAAARAGGLHRYTQLCRASGTAELGGRRRAVDAAALRTHRWGPAGEGGRARFVTAAAGDGTVISLVAVGPDGATPHGEELLGGQLLPAQREAAAPGPLETVRLSTVYDDEGLPVKTGAELFRSGDELPSRLAGVAAGGVATRLGGLPASLTLFHFTIDGVPAMGAYEIEGGG